MIEDSPVGSKLLGFYRGQVILHLTHGYCKIYIPAVYPLEWKDNPSLIPPAEQASSLFAGTNTGSGVFTYPNIGSIVWVFFANNDLNYPIYFASSLGGENAFGQYEITKSPSEDISERHLITSGKTHIEWYENGKLSIQVEDPDRRDSIVNYNNSYIGLISDDAVASRPICEKVEAEELSNIHCKIVLDNDNYTHGSISSCTHFYDLNRDEKIELDGKYVTDYTLTVNTNRIQNDDGVIYDNQISTLDYSKTAIIFDLQQSLNTISSFDANESIESTISHKLNGTLDALLTDEGDRASDKTTTNLTTGVIETLNNTDNYHNNNFRTLNLTGLIQDSILLQNNLTQKYTLTDAKNLSNVISSSAMSNLLVGEHSHTIKNIVDNIQNKYELKHDYSFVDVSNLFWYTSSDNIVKLKQYDENVNFGKDILKKQQNDDAYNFSDSYKEILNYYVISSLELTNTTSYKNAIGFDSENNLTLKNTLSLHDLSTHNYNFNYTSFHNDITKPKDTIIYDYSFYDKKNKNAIETLTSYNSSLTKNYLKTDNYDLLTLDPNRLPIIIELSTKQYTDNISISKNCLFELGSDNYNYEHIVHTIDNEKTHFNVSTLDFYNELSDEITIHKSNKELNAGQNILLTVDYEYHNYHNLEISSYDIVLNTLKIDEYEIYKEDQTKNGTIYATCDNNTACKSNTTFVSSLTANESDIITIENYEKNNDNAYIGTKQGIKLNTSSYRKNENVRIELGTKNVDGYEIEECHIDNFDGSDDEQIGLKTSDIKYYFENKNVLREVIVNLEDNSIKSKFTTKGNASRNLSLSGYKVLNNEIDKQCTIDYVDDTYNSTFSQLIEDKITENKSLIKVDTKTGLITIDITGKNGNSKLTLDTEGNVVIDASTMLNVSIGGAKLQMLKGGTITMTGDTTINGKLHVTGDITTPSDVKAGSISLKNHTHPGCQGGSTGTPR